MGTQTFSLNWSNHKANMSTVLQQLFTAKAFVDVTIVCDGLSLKAHKMVLSASSPLFRRLLLENPCQHPIVIMTDITYSDMEALLDFMYRGEIDVTQEKLSQFLRTAEKLKIKGLSSSDCNTSKCSQKNLFEKQIPTNIEGCLITARAEPETNSTHNSSLERTAVPIVSNNSLEMNKDQQRAASSVKLEDSFKKPECVDSEHNYSYDQCWRNTSDNSISTDKICATELAKSTISCLRHWEGLTNGNPSFAEYPVNETSNVPQVISGISENLPMVSDDEDLQDRIFPPSVVQQTMEKPAEDLHLSKIEQPEEENFEFSKEYNFESSNDYTSKTKHVESEKVDNEKSENVLPEVSDSQTLGSSVDVQLANNGDSKEPCEYNPYLTCDVCKKSFEDLKRLCLHRRSHNSEQGPFTCTTCGKIFGVKSRFRCHLRTHSAKRPFSCSVCNKAFLRNEHLQDHLRIHSGEKPFSCTICEKKFITKGHLTIHSRSHTGEKPYVCDFCQKKFVKSSDLMTHLRVHTGEKPYTCTICGKRFARTANLKTHTARNHSTEYQPTTANWP